LAAEGFDDRADLEMLAVPQHFEDLGSVLGYFGDLTNYFCETGGDEGLFV
jgi:hypothetical protein